MKIPLVIKIKRGHNDMENKDYFWFTIHGRNHKITATGEMYTRKHSAIKTAKTYIDDGLNALIIDQT